MLGKTNITTLSESAIVTEVEDFNWIQMQSGVSADFVKAIYKNGYLVGITVDGSIVYTTDGEAWQTYMLEYEDCKLNDIDWDGSRFVLAGSYKESRELSDGTSREIQSGLIVVTSDFTVYEKKQIESKNGNASEYFLVYPKNGKYIVIGNIQSSTSKTYICVGNLEDQWESEQASNYLQYNMAKNSRDIIAVVEEPRMGTSSYYIRRISGDTITTNDYTTNITVRANTKVFECKDELYIMNFVSYYNLYKITNSDECMVMSSEKNFAFVDGVYFNNCQIFINNHEMLIVKKGESIADKTLDDMIEIAPELTMNCITKAFGQLYIFGNQGVILKSSVETNNEEVIIVQAISAKKALLDSKKYTDERYAALEERIAALESGESGNNG